MLKVEGIAIFVSDWKKAEKWYSGILGFKLIKMYPKVKCAYMKFGNMHFHIETPCKEWGLGWKKAKIGIRTPIIFETEHIEKTVNELKKKKVKFVEEISMRSWGEYKAVFQDLDGNEFGLVSEKL